MHIEQIQERSDLYNYDEDYDTSMQMSYSN